MVWLIYILLHTKCRAFLYDHGIVDKTEESLRDMVVYGLIMLYMVKKNQELE